MREVERAYLEFPAFLEYEKGLITDDAFRMALKKEFSFEAADERIDQSWNAMLVSLPDAKLKMLNTLKDHFDVFLLSNTNSIHLNHIEEVMLGGHTLDSHFHKAYYSHRLNMRKPDADVFRHVLNDNNLAPSKTIFLDDNADNTAGASRLGIHTILVKDPAEVFDLFKGYA